APKSAGPKVLLQQLETGALGEAVPSIEVLRTRIVAADLQGDVPAPAPPRFCLGFAQQVRSRARGAMARRDEELVDLRCKPLMLEAEDVDDDDVSDRLPRLDGDPGRAQCRRGQQTLQLFPKRIGLKPFEALELPVLGNEGHQRRGIAGSCTSNDHGWAEIQMALAAHPSSRATGSTFVGGSRRASFHAIAGMSGSARKPS